MKYWIRLLLLVGAVIGFIMIALSLLPRSYDFSTSIEIEAPPSAVFAEVNRLQSWPEWSRQFNTSEIEKLKINYNEVDAGQGAAQTWTERRGDGKLWITESQPDQLVKYETKFSGFPAMKSSFEFSATQSGGTRIVWSSKGKLPGGPMYGVMAPFFPDQMTYEYNKSLTRLKENLEQK